MRKCSRNVSAFCAVGAKAVQTNIINAAKRTASRETARPRHVTGGEMPYMAYNYTYRNIFS